MRLASKYRLGSDLALSIPVVQAGLGRCDGPVLAATVSRAGALGTLTVGDLTPRAFAASLRAIRRITSRPVVIAFNAEWESEDLIDLAFRHDFRHFGVFWWNGPRLSRRIHDAGGTVLWQVGTLGQVRDALDCEADVLIAQGTEAGGQVRSPIPIREFLAEILSVTAGAVPIVAGGGLATRKDVEEVIGAGAAAGLLGTRFLMTPEARALQSDKVRLGRARSVDLTLDLSLVGDWPCAPRRRLMLPSGCDRVSLFAGSGLNRINTIRSAAEVVRLLAPRVAQLRMESADNPGITIR